MKLRTNFKLLALVFIILYIILGNNVVNAAGFDISATSYDVKIGENVTINVNFTAAAWDIVVSGNGITEGVYAGYTEDLSEKTTSKSINLDTSTEGTYTITMTGTITDANGAITKVNKLISVKVSKAEIKPDTNTGTTGDTANNNTPTTTTPEEPKKSTEARLSNLGIKPNDFTGFKRDKYDYSVEVPNDVAEVEIYGTKKDSKATVEGLGKVSLKEGNNTFEVKVTAEDGKTTKTYKLTIKRRTAAEDAVEMSEARLSNFGIKPEEYDFSGFSKDKTEYTAEVPNEVKEIEVYAKAIDSKAQITGTGMIELKEGENEIKVEVIAQNGEKKAYTIKVTRKVAEKTEEPVTPVEDKEKFGLSTLEITGITLNKKFDSGIYEYSMELTEDLASLPISVKATDKDATVEIIGNENLQPGENTITILVQNAKTEEVATYQIIVNKNIQEETVRTSWLKPSTWGKEEIIKIAMIVVIIILIIIAVILKIQIAKDKKDEKKVDLPGADALDKALAEHQELATEELLGEENITVNEVVNEEQQETFAISEATKGEVKKFLEEFPQEEIQEINENVESNEEQTRVSVDDLFNNDDFGGRPKRRGRGKHF